MLTSLKDSLLLSYQKRVTVMHFSGVDAFSMAK